MAVDKEMEAVFKSSRTGYDGGGFVESLFNPSERNSSNWANFIRWMKEDKEEEETTESAFDRFLENFMGDPVERGMRKKERGEYSGSKYNEGGAVPDNTVGVDPVSGNPVPAGSLPEEVRDDIPAQLSEGEYVVPADVLRYYGVKFFEDLRAEAKYAYQDMNDNGRIGGEPVGMETVEPEDDMMFDISELEFVEEEGQPAAFAEGGDTSTYQDTGGFGDLSGGFDTTAYAEGMGQVEMRAYQNDMGRKIMITFIDGEPQMDIPEGYYPVGTEAVAIEPEDTAVQSQGGGGGGGGSPVPAPEPINYQGLTISEMEDMLKEQQGMTGNLITAGAGIVNPIIGMAVKFGLSQNAKQLEAEMQRRIKSGTLTDAERAKMEDMLAQAQEDKPSLLERLYGKLTGKDGGDYEGVEKGAVDAAVKEAMGYEPVDATGSDVKGSTIVPITTETLDPATNEPDNTKAGSVEGGYKHVNEGYRASKSEKGNTAGQGDSSTPMADAFGTGNTFTNEPAGSTSRSSGSSGGGTDFAQQMREDAAARNSAAQAGVSAVQSQMASSGQSAAQVGRTNAPSTARTSNTGSGSGGTATRNDSVSATDASDPRSGGGSSSGSTRRGGGGGRNKGGLMDKKKKK